MSAMDIDGPVGGLQPALKRKADTDTVDVGHDVEGYQSVINHQDKRIKHDESYIPPPHRLPVEIWYDICDQLPLRDKLALAKVSRWLFNVVNPQVYHHDIKDKHSSCIWWAISKSKVGTLKRALEYCSSDVDLNSTTYWTRWTRRPLLHTAITRQNITIVELLLTHGADPNIQDAVGTAALCVAAKVNPPGCLPVLLSQGANPNETDRCGLPLFISGEVTYYFNSVFWKTIGRETYPHGPNHKPRSIPAIDAYASLLAAGARIDTPVTWKWLLNFNRPKPLVRHILIHASIPRNISLPVIEKAIKEILATTPSKRFRTWEVLGLLLDVVYRWTGEFDEEALKALVEVVVTSERQHESICNQERIDAVYMLLGYADLTEDVVREIWSVTFPVLDGRRRKGDPY